MSHLEKIYSKPFSPTYESTDSQETRSAPEKTPLIDEFTTSSAGFFLTKSSHPYSDKKIKRLADKLEVCDATQQSSKACGKNPRNWVLRAAECVGEEKYTSAQWCLKHALNPSVTKDSTYSAEILKKYYSARVSLHTISENYLELVSDDLLSKRKSDPDRPEPTAHRKKSVTDVDMIAKAQTLKNMIGKLILRMEDLESPASFSLLSKAIVDALSVFQKNTEALLEKYD